MTTIPAGICRVNRNNFKRHYLRKKQTFSDFLWHFWNVHEIWSILKKNHEYPSLILSEIIDAEKRGYLQVQKVLLKNTIH